MSQNMMGTPAAVVGFKVVLLKAVLVISATVLTSYPKFQAIMLLLGAAAMTYYHLRWMPYYWPWLNHIWTGLWGGLTVTASVLVAIAFSDLLNIDLFWRATISQVCDYDSFQGAVCGMLFS